MERLLFSLQGIYKTLLFILVLLFCVNANSATVTLQWNSVAEADGYKVYYGTASGLYNAPIYVSNQTSKTLTLCPGTYYFALTAYNEYGESDYSEEVVGTVHIPCPVDLCINQQPPMAMMSYNPNTGKVKFSWTNTGADSYKLYKYVVGSNDIEIYSGTDLSHEFSYENMKSYYVVGIKNGVESNIHYMITVIKTSSPIQFYFGYM